MPLRCNEYGIADLLYVLFVRSHHKVMDPTEDETKTGLGLGDFLTKALKASVTTAWETVLVQNV